MNEEACRLAMTDHHLREKNTDFTDSRIHRIVQPLLVVSVESVQSV